MSSLSVFLLFWKNHLTGYGEMEIWIMFFYSPWTEQSGFGWGSWLCIGHDSLMWYIPSFPSQFSGGGFWQSHLVGQRHCETNSFPFSYLYVSAPILVSATVDLVILTKKPIFRKFIGNGPMFLLLLVPSSWSKWTISPTMSSIFVCVVPSFIVFYFFIFYIFIYKSQSLYFF